MIIEFGEFLGNRADLNVAAITQNTFWISGNSRKSHISAPAGSYFGLGQCRKGDNSRGGTVFDVEFAKDVFDVPADRSGGCVEDHADLMIRFTLCDPSQNLRFSRGETPMNQAGFLPAVVWFLSSFCVLFLFGKDVVLPGVVSSAVHLLSSAWGVLGEIVRVLVRIDIPWPYSAGGIVWPSVSSRH